MLSIKGLEKTSLIDYPGKLASVIFLPNCNFRCPYCQNPDLILKQKELPDISEEDVLAFLKRRRDWVDGVCFTGGEPCLHKGLPEFIRKVKRIGLPVKLDTNGSNPGMLENLLREGLLDYIAMDIKAPLERYSKVVKRKVKPRDIERSVELIRKSGLEYEFRITLVPRLFRKEDIIKIGKWLRGSRVLYLQQFKPDITLDKRFEKERPFSLEKIQEIADLARPYFRRVELRV